MSAYHWLTALPNSLSWRRHLGPVDQHGCVLLYRVEHRRAGCGPYTAFERLRWGPWGPGSAIFREIDAPAPAQNLRAEYRRLGLPSPSRGFMAEPVTQKLAPWRFAFQTPQALLNWMGSPRAVGLLSAQDFIVRPYRVPARDCRATRVQVVFRPERARAMGRISLERFVAGARVE